MSTNKPTQVQLDNLAQVAKQIADLSISCYPLMPTIEDPFVEGLLMIRISHILGAMGKWYAQNIDESTWQDDLKIDRDVVFEASDSIGKMEWSSVACPLWEIAKKMVALADTGLVP